MTYVHVLRRRWRTVLVVILLGLALAALYVVLAPKTYQSTLKFFVSTSGSADTSQLAQGSTFTQQRVKSYTELVRAPVLLGPVIKDTGLNTDPTRLAGDVSATIPPDTVLIDVAVTAPTPEQAKKVADSIAAHFPDVVADLERVREGQTSPVKVTLVRAATLADTQTSPRPLRSLAIGLGLGLMLGLGAALVKHLMDTKLRTKDDVEGITDVAVLAGIPFDPEAAESPLIIQADPQGGRAEAFRSLRTNLNFVDAANHPRIIVVTSSIAGEGKSSTTANLALAMAESGASVCVIEGDLRRPRLLSYLGMTGGVGLTDVLIGKYELEDVLQPFGDLPLSVLGAGPSPPNPSELLGSQAMSSVLRYLSLEFDYVLIDAAPLLPVTDAAVLTAQADGAVIVAGSGIVARDQFQHAVESLKNVGANVIGIVINRMPRAGGGGYYDYRYEYRSATPTSRAQAKKDAQKDKKAKRLISR